MTIRSNKNHWNIEILNFQGKKFRRKNIEIPLKIIFEGFSGEFNSTNTNTQWMIWWLWYVFIDIEIGFCHEVWLYDYWNKGKKL
jgi:hypothetical protein